VARFSRKPRSGPAPGLLSRPGRASFPRPATLLGFASSLRSVHPTQGRSKRLVGGSGPTCRFAPSTRREFHRRGAVPVRASQECPCRGSWASRFPQVSRTVSSADPAMAFMHRVARELAGQDCPGIRRPLSGIRPRASGLHFWGPVRPGFPSADRDVAAAMNVTTGERALRRCTRGRRLADPGVVPARAGVPV